MFVVLTEADGHTVRTRPEAERRHVAAKPRSSYVKRSGLVTL